MSRLPSLKYRDVVASLRRHGFEYNRKTGRVTMVACHPGDLPRGTLRAIIAQTGLSVDEFLS